jgi:uncharacterized protein with PIN domain
MKFHRPTAYREFINVPMDDNPTQTVDIGANLLLHVEESMERCLKVNVDIFAISPEEMTRIDQEVACHIA